MKNGYVTFVNDNPIYLKLCDILVESVINFSENPIEVFSINFDYKHSSENAENVEKNEVDYIREYYKTLADRYTSRYLDYITNNSALFPEYDANEPGDVYPNDNINYGGWIL